MNTRYPFRIGAVEIDLEKRIYHHHNQIPVHPPLRAIAATLRRGGSPRNTPRWIRTCIQIDAGAWPVNNIFMPLRQLTWRVLRRRSAAAQTHFPNVFPGGPR